MDSGSAVDMQGPWSNWVQNISPNIRNFMAICQFRLIAHWFLCVAKKKERKKDQKEYPAWDQSMSENMLWDFKFVFS